MDEAESKDDNSGWESDGAEYSPKSEFSKPKVVEEAVGRCMLMRAKEMSKGYFNTTITKDGFPIKSWIEDSRKVYCSSVQALKSILIPEINEKGDDDKDKRQELKKAIADAQTRINQLFKKYAYHYLEPVRVGGITKHRRTGRFYMPEIDAMVLGTEIYSDGFEKLKPKMGHWNNYVNNYWDEMVDLHQTLFEQLILIVHSTKYYLNGIR